MATINICDVCETRENVNKRQYYEDRRSNGQEIEDTHDIFDLCEKCELEIFRTFIKENHCKNQRDKNICEQHLSKIIKNRIKGNK